MTIARDLANVASLMASSGANVAFDNTIVVAGATAGTYAYFDAQKRLVTGATPGGGGGGSGDVTGPASSISGNIATFNGTTGKIIQDGGKALPSGAIVGISDAQALSNKIISGSNNTLSNIPNSATTAASANGASTIVARDANGDFTVRNITINAADTATAASHYIVETASDGILRPKTLANAQAEIVTAATVNAVAVIAGSTTQSIIRYSGTTAVAGQFDGGTTTPSGTTRLNYGGYLYATRFYGDGSNLTSIPNSATTASSANGANLIVARDANGSFTANVVTATTLSGTHTGNGAGLTNLDAGNIATGTVANARTTAASANGASTIVARDVNGDFAANRITANGAFLSSLSAANIVGTVAVTNGGTGLATIPALSVPVANTLNTISSLTAAAGQSIRINAGGTSWEAYTPTSGGDVTGPASSVSGNIATFNGISGKAIQDGGKALPSGTIVGTSDAQALSNKTISGSNNTLSNIPNSATTASSANGANLIVARDVNGDFTANVITANLFSGSGASLSSINASSITTGTLASPDITENVQVIGTNTNAVRSRIYILTASLTLTLPSSPSVGDTVSFRNRSGTTTAVIARNGSNIMSLAEDMTLDSVHATGTLVYVDATRGWTLV